MLSRELLASQTITAQQELSQPCAACLGREQSHTGRAAPGAVGRAAAQAAHARPEQRTTSMCACHTGLPCPHSDTSHAQAALDWLAEQPLVQWAEPQPKLHRHNYLATGVCQSQQASAVDSTTGYGVNQSATHQLWAAGLQVCTARAVMQGASAVSFRVPDGFTGSK